MQVLVPSTETVTGLQIAWDGKTGRLAARCACGGSVFLEEGLIWSCFECRAQVILDHRVRFSIFHLSSLTSQQRLEYVAEQLGYLMGGAAIGKVSLQINWNA